MTINEFVAYAYADIDDEEMAYEALWKKKDPEPQTRGQAFIAKVKKICEWIKELITVKIPKFFKKIFKKNKKFKLSKHVKAIKAHANELGLTEKDLAGIAVSAASATPTLFATIKSKGVELMKKAGFLGDQIQQDMNELVKQASEIDNDLQSKSDFGKRKGNQITKELSKIEQKATKDRAKYQTNADIAKDEAKRHNDDFNSKYSTKYTDKKKQDANGNWYTERQYAAGDEKTYKKNMRKKWLRDTFGIGRKDYEESLTKQKELTAASKKANNELAEFNKGVKESKKAKTSELRETWDNKYDEHTKSARQFMAEKESKIQDAIAAKNRYENEMSKLSKKYDKMNQKLRKQGKPTLNVTDDDKWKEYKRKRDELENSLNIINQKTGSIDQKLKS